VVNVVVLRLLMYYAGNFWDNPRMIGYWHDSVVCLSVTLCIVAK